MAFLTSITRAGLAAVIGLLSTGVSETLVSDALPVPPAVALARFDGIRAPDDASPGTPTASLAPLVTVSNATGQQFDRLGEALAKFAKVGLELPDLEVWFYGDKSDCDGRRGSFNDNIVPWRIEICGDLDATYEHELAHAWEAANLDDARRSAFMAMLGLTTWSNSDVPRSELGIEQAAFIIQQGLLTQPIIRLSEEMRNRLDAFELLTDVASPREVGAPPRPRPLAQSVVTRST